jgi:DNA-binding MarR family transcriptional regulator
MNLKEIQGIKLGEVENSIGYLLRRGHRMARDVTIPILAKHGLSQLELTTLCLVNENRDCTLRNISKAVYLEPPAMHRLLNGLEKKGLISRSKSEQDARYTLTRITPLGEKKIADSIDDIRNIERTFLGKLSGSQRNQLFAILQALTLD